MRSILQLFSESFVDIKSNIHLYFRIALVPLILSVAALIADPDFGLDLSSVVGYEGQDFLFLFLMIISALASIWMSVAVVHTFENAGVSVGDAYKNTRKAASSFFVASIIGGLAILLGLLFLVIPGAWLLVATYFYVHYIVLRNKSAVESLKMSYNLVKRRWWNVFPRLIMLFIFVIAIYLALETLNASIPSVFMTSILEASAGMFITIFALIFSYKIFRDLETTAVTAESVTPTPAQAQPSEG